MSFDEIIKSATFNADDQYLSNLLSFYIENASNSGSTGSFSRVMEESIKDDTLLNDQDYKQFFVNIFSIIREKNLNQNDIISKIKRVPDVLSFKSDDFEGNAPQEYECNVLEMIPNKSSLINIVSEIRANCALKGLSYHMEIPDINVLKSNKASYLKLYCTEKNLVDMYQILSEIESKYGEEIKTRSNFSAPISSKIGYYSVDIEKGLSERDIIGSAIIKALDSSLVALMQANPEFAVNLPGGAKKVGEVALDEQNRATIAYQFMLAMQQSFTNFVLQYVKIQFQADGIDVTNLFMSPSAKLATDLSNQPNNSQELKPLEEDLGSNQVDSPVDNPVDSTRYSSIYSDEQLNLTVTTKNGSEIRFLDLLDNFKILDYVPLDAQVVLNDGSVMNGVEFWQAYGMGLTRCENIDNFLLAYTNSVVKNTNPKKENQGKKGFLSKILKK